MAKRQRKKIVAKQKDTPKPRKKRNRNKHNPTSSEDGVARGTAALKEQSTRTAKLNALASQLNTIMSTHADQLKHYTFYHKVQKKFRSTSTDNRLLLLYSLKEMELHPTYPLHRTGRCDIEVKRKGKKMTVTLKVDHHPQPGKKEANCYFYEVLLLLWNKTDRPPVELKQYSDWVMWNRNDPADKFLPIFDFVFPVTSSTTQWLVAVRRKLGKNKANIGLMAADGMQIMEVGTWDKNEAALLKKAAEEAKAHSEKAAVEPIRVKPRPGTAK